MDKVELLEIQKDNNFADVSVSVCVCVCVCVCVGGGSFGTDLSPSSP